VGTHAPGLAAPSRRPDLDTAPGPTGRHPERGATRQTALRRRPSLPPPLRDPATEDTVDNSRYWAAGLGYDRPYVRQALPDIGTASEARVLHYPRHVGRLAKLLRLRRRCNCGATWRTCPDRIRRR